MQDTKMIEPEDKITRKGAHEILTQSYTSMYGMFLFFCGVTTGVLLDAFFSDKLFNNYFSLVLVLMAVTFFILAQKSRTKFNTRLGKMLDDIK